MDHLEKLAMIRALETKMGTLTIADFDSAFSEYGERLFKEYERKGSAEIAARLYVICKDAEKMARIIINEKDNKQNNKESGFIDDFNDIIDSL